MKNPQFPFFVRDWICSRRVLQMSGDAVKAYVYLLCEAWLQIPRATIPQDENEIASMARVSMDQWKCIKNDIMNHWLPGKCTEHKGRFYNELLLEISRKHEAKQRLNNENAKRSQIDAEKPISDKLLAKDIADHPLKTDIEGILEIGVRGLENDPKGNFNPGEVLSRGEYAMMLEDISAKPPSSRGWPSRSSKVTCLNCCVTRRLWSWIWP